MFVDPAIVQFKSWDNEMTKFMRSIVFLGVLAGAWGVGNAGEAIPSLENLALQKILQLSEDFEQEGRRFEQLLPPALQERIPEAREQLRFAQQELLKRKNLEQQHFKELQRLRLKEQEHRKQQNLSEQRRLQILEPYVRESIEKQQSLERKGVEHLIQFAAQRFIEGEELGEYRLRQKELLHQHELPRLLDHLQEHRRRQEHLGKQRFHERQRIIEKQLRKLLRR